MKRGRMEGERERCKKKGKDEGRGKREGGMGRKRGGMGRKRGRGERWREKKERGNYGGEDKQVFRCEITTGKTLDMGLRIKNTNLFSIMYPCQAFHSWSSSF